MPESTLHIERRPERFTADPRRVITRLFLPGGKSRIRALIDRVLRLRHEEVTALLEQVFRDFRERHRDLEAVFERHAGQVAAYMPEDATPSPEHRLLLGAYFTMEYTIESAALFNPSIVPHHDQSGLEPGQARFLMSLRATGEGHVSSIVFRTGIVDAAGGIHMDPRSPFSRRLHAMPDHHHEKQRFFHKLIEMGAYTEAAGFVLDRLPERFTYAQLEEAISQTLADPTEPRLLDETADHLRWLSRSNYALEIPPDMPPCEVVIFPTSENEIRGIEDMRLVRFVDDDGSATYYGTYTAYNGFRILPQLMETTRFERIRINTLNGHYCQNKGLALFPRKIGGWYVMIGRQDGESLYLLRSKNIRFWNEANLIQTPTYPWEFVQIGNCGSPLETERGWLLITHGVGPMRTYCIGATLLDLEDPSRVIGQMRQPLLAPNEQERDGYVPNVVYSCGAMIHGDRLILPYAMSDSATGFATCSLPELLDHLTHV